LTLILKSCFLLSQLSSESCLLILPLIFTTNPACRCPRITKAAPYSYRSDFFPFKNYASHLRYQHTPFYTSNYLLVLCLLPTAHKIQLKAVVILHSIFVLSQHFISPRDNDKGPNNGRQTQLTTAGQNGKKRTK